jgi:mono/diheme cytochrome c family protein
MAVASFVSLVLNCASAVAVDKLTYHSDAQRSGWNPHEQVLTPLSVASPAFGLRWQTPILDYVEGVPPRVFATPLYVSGIEPRTGPFKGRRFSVLYVISSTGFAYAINATASGPVEAGTILWRKRLTGSPCAEGTMGNLSTPVVDRPLSRIYVTSCEGASHWQAHALDLRDGEEQSGWPVAIDAQAVNVFGINHNGTTRFRDQDTHFQRGALNLSPDRARLYVTFGFDDSSGWLIAIDTHAHKVAAAFSSTARTEEIQGGMWSSGGPSVDRHGKVYIATGASSTQMLRHAGIPGVFPDSPHSWGQSILQFTDSGQPGTVTAGLRPYPDWNEYVLLVSGNRFAQAINGLLVNDTSDDDFEGRADTGGFSLHFDAAGRSEIEVADVKLTETGLLLDWNQRFATHPRRVPSALTAEQARVFQAGRDIYRQRCAACHGNPQSGAPPMQSLAQFPAGRITDVLTNGLMRDMAAGLVDEDKRSVALFLTTQSADTP